MKGAMHLVGESDADQIGQFFDFIFNPVPVEGQNLQQQDSAYVYLAFKQPQGSGNFSGLKGFEQQFFLWPSQRSELISAVVETRPRREVYYAPSLFTAPSALKEHVKGSWVYWCEFDGRVPQLPLEDFENPTLRVLSSEEGHEHWYWKSLEFIEPKQLEYVNRAVTYKFGADSSGWDANQILRPPWTFNHKRNQPVVLQAYEPKFVSFSDFKTLPEPPPYQEVPLPERIPAVEEVIFRYKFPGNVTQLFKLGLPVGKRSEGMMALGFYLAEMNLSNEEMLSVLLNADERWGKFKGRADQLKRLMEIVTIARQKYPFNPTAEYLGTPKLQPLGFLTALRTDVHVEWCWDGWLQKAGYMLLTGPSGIGKTQLALDVAGSMALGQMALDSPTQQTKIGFFSLEMNLPELKEFLQLMESGFTPDQQEILEQQLLFFPLGEPLYLNKQEPRELVEQMISDHNLDGIIVDSLGSATDGDLSNETAVKGLLDWNDRLRQRTGAFTWFIHHHRKASGENKKPNKLSDVYGNQYLTSRATTVVCLWDGGVSNTIEFIPLKVRLRANPGKFHIRRGDDLRFTRIVSGVLPKEPLESIEVVTPNEISKEPKEEKSQGAGTKSFSI